MLAALAFQNPAMQLSRFIVSATEEAAIVKKKQDCSTPDTHVLSLWNRRTQKLMEYRTSKLQDLQEVNKLTQEVADYAGHLRINEWLKHCASFNQHTSVHI